MKRVLPGGALLRPGRLASRSFIRSSRSTARHRPAGLHRRAADLPRALRGQRPAQAAADDRQLQHRRLAVLGMVRHGPPADRRHQRSLQARRQLHHLRHDALTVVARGSWLESPVVGPFRAEETLLSVAVLLASGDGSPRRHEGHEGITITAAVRSERSGFSDIGKLCVSLACSALYVVMKASACLRG